ncbi:SCO2525 family SAM-dependent methyltransferase [Kibdelosporangium lantanae]|uniref:SCO2525 family SAM-dependent methyltransferase n=1 Tax=Kibdelosporangium lantanae TaxID=1497396 RepID=A0ABW3MGV4_9PSEU
MTVPRGQNDFDWNGFDTAVYYAHNYLSLRDDDREIIERVGDHFAARLRDRQGLRGIDVGTGPNLYPALTMLPFCSTVTLFEHARTNLDWLFEQKDNGWPSWDDAWGQCWKVLSDLPVYQQFDDPQNRLVERADIQPGNVYELSPEKPYDVGTMFFVAESITERESEFRSGVDHFLDALVPGAPFAIAFMEHSAGYHVADHEFPATDIDGGTVRRCLATRVDDVQIERIKTGDKPLRDGYTGMLLALGRVNTDTKEGGPAI